MCLSVSISVSISFSVSLCQCQYFSISVFLGLPLTPPLCLTSVVTSRYNCKLSSLSVFNVFWLKLFVSSLTKSIMVTVLPAVDVNTCVWSSPYLFRYLSVSRISWSVDCLVNTFIYRRIHIENDMRIVRALPSFKACSAGCRNPSTQEVLFKVQNSRTRAD